MLARRRIHCPTYCHLGFLLEMQHRGFVVTLRGPIPTGTVALSV